MFCTNCGHRNENAAFCGNLGARISAGFTPPPGPPSYVAQGPPPAVSTGNGFSTAGIILGAIAFPILPIVFGPAGLILGAIGTSKGEQKAVVAMVVSALGLVVDMFLGLLVWSQITAG